ncbi:Ltp family lipoprotein, partial [Staphylococcus aureus]
YHQLTSEYGNKFSKDDAQYAIDHLKADYNKNALESAKSYAKSLNMSTREIYDQLISEYGGRFTPSEAQYAIDHLDK